MADLVLLMRFPDATGAGKTCDSFVYNHDIAPTILSYLGIAGAEGMEGKNLLPLINGGAPLYDHVSVGYGPFVMVRDEEYWYNAYLWGEAERLYFLPDDPGLSDDIAGEKPDVLKRMRKWALDDAGGAIPGFLRELAGSNIPGCTPMEATLDIM